MLQTLQSLSQKARPLVFLKFRQRLNEKRLSVPANSADERAGMNGGRKLDKKGFLLKFVWKEKKMVAKFHSRII